MFEIYMKWFKGRKSSFRLTSSRRKSRYNHQTVQKPINLWKRTKDGRLVFVRILQPGEVYRVHGYDARFGGQYAVGGGYYVTDIDTHIRYETPSKEKLKLVNGE